MKTWMKKIYELTNGVIRDVRIQSNELGILLDEGSDISDEEKLGIVSRIEFQLKQKIDDRCIYKYDHDELQWVSSCDRYDPTPPRIEEPFCPKCGRKATIYL